MDRITRSIPLDGARIAFIQHAPAPGSARGRAAMPDLVIVPSLLAAMKGYLPTFQALATWSHVTLVEPPGSGLSSRVTRAWGFEDYGRWLTRFLVAMDLRRAILVGHSNSGAAVLSAAAHDPSRIAALALCGSVGADDRHSVFRTLWGRWIDTLLEPSMSLTRWPYLMHNLLLHPANFTRHVFLSVAADMTAIAPRVRVPTLLAWGAHDHTMPLRCRDRFATLLPNAHLYTSKAGSHDWLITHPHEFSAAVRCFVTHDVEEATRDDT